MPRKQVRYRLRLRVWTIWAKSYTSFHPCSISSLCQRSLLQCIGAWNSSSLQCHCSCRLLSGIKKETFWGFSKYSESSELVSFYIPCTRHSHLWFYNLCIHRTDARILHNRSNSISAQIRFQVKLREKKHQFSAECSNPMNIISVNNSPVNAIRIKIELTSFKFIFDLA